MNEGLRTPGGGRIDRSRALRFSFDGRAYSGFAGDTLASALLASGVHLMGRSFKYHRPRGALAAGAEEPNALVAVRRDAARYTPNLRATQVELYEGLEAHSQNRWPSLAFDVGAVNDLFAPFLPAGFYYKTFMWPRGAWQTLYEPRIRAAAGLGRSPTLADPDRYAARYAHCDVLVVGGGPAGLASATAAASAGEAAPSIARPNTIFSIRDIRLLPLKPLLPADPVLQSTIAKPNQKDGANARACHWCGGNLSHRARKCGRSCAQQSKGEHQFLGLGHRTAPPKVCISGRRDSSEHDSRLR